MTLTHLLAFNLALAAAWISPGPAMLYALREALARGRAAGLAAGCGLGLVAAGWTGAALLGLDGLFALVPGAYGALKIGGALYLLWLAWRTWRGAGAPIQAGAARRVAGSFWGGVAVSLANPKAVLFSAAVLVVIFPPEMTVGEKALIVANQAALECLAYGGLALIATTEAARARYLRAKRLLDRIAAGAMGALGLRLLTDR